MTPSHFSNRDGVISGAGRAREPESLERQFVRWAYQSDETTLPYRPASQEPKRRPNREPLPPINRVLFALTDAGCDWKPAARDVDSWQAQCPTHTDTRPSLQVRRNPDGSLWLKCWAGCSKEGILAALGLEWRDLWDGGQFDSGRRDGLNLKPLLPPHLRRAVEDLIRLDDERRAA
jgi:hypothetical protein